MADDAKFEQSGANLLVSMGMFAVAGPRTLAGAIGIVTTIVDFITSGTPVDALAQLRDDIAKIESVLSQIDSEIESLVDQVAIESNRQTLARLNGHLDEFRLANARLNDHPGDVDVAVEAAHEAGVHLDEFLRDDFEIWRWVDVVERDGHRDLAPDRFKNLPTLPVYSMGAAVWLAARQTVFDAGQIGRLVEDQARVDRHLSAVSPREGFDKYGTGSLGMPTTIAENVLWHVRAWVITGHEQPEDETCDYFFQVRDWMTNRRTTADGFSIVVASNNVLCTIDPTTVGAPDTELRWEAEAGADVLDELAETLDRVAHTGSARRQLIAPFPEGVAYPPSYLYVVTRDSNLDWYRNDESTRPGDSTTWEGPKQIGTGFGGFSTFFNGGGAAMYGVQLDGTLLWYGFDGSVDGEPTWREPKVVGRGWSEFTHVFPGGEFVIYGILPTGALHWYRHFAGRHGGGGPSDWLGPREVGVGWGGYPTVFSGGDGVIYGIDSAGNLHRAVHKGYLDGTKKWDGPFRQIGVGWDGFVHVAAAWDGVIYGFKRDGRVMWCRYGDPRKQAGAPGPFGPPVYLSGPLLGGDARRGQMRLSRLPPSVLRHVGPFRGTKLITGDPTDHPRGKDQERWQLSIGASDQQYPHTADL